MSKITDLNEYRKRRQAQAENLQPDTQAMQNFLYPPDDTADPEYIKKLAHFETLSRKVPESLHRDEFAKIFHYAALWAEDGLPEEALHKFMEWHAEALTNYRMLVDLINGDRIISWNKEEQDLAIVSFLEEGPDKA